MKWLPGDDSPQPAILAVSTVAMTQVGGGAGRSSLIKQLNKVAYIYQGRLAGSSDAANAYTAVLLGTKIPRKVAGTGFHRNPRGLKPLSAISAAVASPNAS